MNFRALMSCVALAAITFSSAASGEVHGTWTAKIEKKRPDRLYLSLKSGRNHKFGSTFERSIFAGLSSSTIEARTRVPVQFELRREAGTVTFEGSFREGQGSGDFRFVANAEYLKTLRSLGVRFESGERESDHDLLHLALFDVSPEFIRSMQALGYNESIDKYIAFRIFDVDPEYVREMAAAGFDRLSGDKLVETRIHGATPEYIREMRAAGEDLSLQQYIQSRIFQVSPAFAEEMSRLGYPDLERGTLVQFRIHGVDAEFVRELRELGYSRVPAGKLVAMRIHGVTPAFIRRAAKASPGRVSIDDLIQMRIFNRDPETVRTLDDVE
jgi:hypothetical protein